MCVVCMAGKSLVTFTALPKHKDTLQITSAAPRRPEGIVIWVLLIALVLSTRSTFLNQAEKRKVGFSLCIGIYEEDV